ncbi:MAG: sel1 repeat family protein, partial [Gemmatimonadetes bacterium]|nr:sel1 repeat family protein [Gemmatimonadota bacterium]NIR39447.1 sel1 repeat family protein [Actinomycetota bacterium]NIS34201.1 sel1 repeat family protein [Actinomycetota bacterium]NIU68974.1 sel1 repeat family protein [Actinomycetota bacterium]NIW30826.1 hypothetical protein [Actinomycetota bacterium]
PATEPPTASETAPVAAAAGTGAAAAAPAEGSEDLDAEAMYDLGNRYHSGNGVPRDPFVAAEWYERAAEQGHGMAAYRLAFMYLRGRGPATKNDYPRAYFWFDVAAGEGVGDAAEWQT